MSEPSNIRYNFCSCNNFNEYLREHKEIRFEIILHAVTLIALVGGLIAAAIQGIPYVNPGISLVTHIFVVIFGCCAIFAILNFVQKTCAAYAAFLEKLESKPL